MALRLIPFKFDTESRKILDGLNGSVNVKANLDKLTMILANKGLKINFAPVMKIESNKTVSVSSGRNIKSDGSKSKDIRD